MACSLTTESLNPANTKTSLSDERVPKLSRFSAIEIGLKLTTTMPFFWGGIITLTAMLSRDLHFLLGRHCYDIPGLSIRSDTFFPLFNSLKLLIWSQHLIWADFSAHLWCNLMSERVIHCVTSAGVERFKESSLSK